MATIKITVKSKEQARLLIELAKDLNFVISAELIPEGFHTELERNLSQKLNSGASDESFKNKTSTEIPLGKFSSEKDFLSMCGLWKNRDITAEKIRKQAWRNINL